jgi:hypothetical protein
MPRHSFSNDHSPAPFDVSGSTSFCRCRSRLAVLSLFQMGILSALGLAIAVSNSEPAPEDDRSPTWSISTGNSCVRTAALAPDGRRLITGETMVKSFFGRSAKVLRKCYFMIGKARLCSSHSRPTARPWPLDVPT